MSSNDIKCSGSLFPINIYTNNLNFKPGQFIETIKGIVYIIDEDKNLNIVRVKLVKGNYPKYNDFDSGKIVDTLETKKWLISQI
jgi:hypothetical protein